MIRLGIDRFFDDGLYRQLRGEHWALLCHHATRDRHGRHLLERLAALGLKPDLLLAPEHGLWGLAQDMEGVDSQLDPVFHLPVHSLYGADEASLRLPLELVGSFRVLVADLQDVGSRYYTYAATLLMLLEQLSGTGTRVVVLDRPDPIDGLTLEGNVLTPSFRSFVGLAQVPNRHAMSLGELARQHLAIRGLQVELQVVAAEGWDRGLPSQSDLGFFWPSPNMPDVATALLYPGLCLVEGTNLSEGRGTTRPFQVVGAPWLHAEDLIHRLERYHLAGLWFLPFAFRPMFGKWAGEVCQGVYVRVTNPHRARPYLAGLCLLQAARQQAPERFAWRTQAYEFVHDRLAIDLLLGDERLRRALEDGEDPRDLVAVQAAALEQFQEERRPHLLYGA
jgi:uncharacterized protein YbbC (DUF1343 family)